MRTGASGTKPTVSGTWRLSKPERLSAGNGGADDRSGTAMNVTVREVTASKRQRNNTFTRCEVEFPDGATGEVTFRVSRGSKAPSMAGLKGTQIAVTGEMRPAQPGRSTGTDIRSLNGRLATTEWQRI